MSLTKILCILFSFGLCACTANSPYYPTKEEAYRIGKEFKKTNICLRFSHVEDLIKSSITGEQAPPNIGIFEILQVLKLRTAIRSTLGQLNKEVKLIGRNINIIQEGYNENFNLITEMQYADCKPYLDYYESAYYKLKQEGY